MTRGEAISRVRSVIKRTTGDAHITNAKIWDVIASALATMLDRNRQLIYRSDSFTTNRFETEIVNLSEYTCIPIDCNVSRIKVPAFLETKNGPTVAGITSEFGNTQYNLVHPSNFQTSIQMSKGFGKFAFLEGEYIYLSEFIPVVKMSYIPVKHPDFCCQLYAPSNIPEHLETQIFSLVYQELSTYLQIPLDVTQNENPNQ